MRYRIGRREQDAFSLAQSSPRRAATDSGAFAHESSPPGARWEGRKQIMKEDEASAGIPAWKL